MTTIGQISFDRGLFFFSRKLHLDEQCSRLTAPQEPATRLVQQPVHRFGLGMTLGASAAPSSLGGMRRQGIQGPNILDTLAWPPLRGAA